jgi:hypothetical protein
MNYLLAELAYADEYKDHLLQKLKTKLTCSELSGVARDLSQNESKILMLKYQKRSREAYLCSR